MVENLAVLSVYPTYPMVDGPVPLILVSVPEAEGVPVPTVCIMVLYIQVVVVVVTGYTPEVEDSLLEALEIEEEVLEEVE
jgi:hypothetical protein